MSLQCQWRQRQMVCELDEARVWPQNAGLARHLHRCATCRTEWEQMQAGAKKLEQSLTAPYPSSQFTEEMWARIDVMEQKKYVPHQSSKRRRVITSLAGCAASAVCLAALIWLPHKAPFHEAIQSNNREHQAAPGKFVRGGKEPNEASLPTTIGNQNSLQTKAGSDEPKTIARLVGLGQPEQNRSAVQPAHSRKWGNNSPTHEKSGGGRPTASGKSETASAADK